MGIALPLFAESEGELVGQHKAFPRVSGSETFFQRGLALPAQIRTGRVEIIEAALHKHVHHPGKLGQIDPVSQFRQPHAAKAEVLFDFRKKVVQSENLQLS